MNRVISRTVVGLALLALAAAGCKKEEAKPAAKEAPKAEAKADDKAADNAKADDKAGADKAGADKAADKPANAPAAPMTPEKIKEMTDKAGSANMDERKIAVGLALNALNAGELDDTKDNFKPGQAAVDGAQAAIGTACGATTNPTVSAEDKEKFKKVVLPDLAQAARTGNSAVLGAIAGSACTSLSSDPAVLKGIDDALGTMKFSAGWQRMFDCVTTNGPMEYARAVEKKADYDRWSTVDRIAAIFKAQADPGARAGILSNLMGFKGKSDALAGAIVASWDALSPEGKQSAATVLGNICAKDAAKPVVDKLAAAAAGSAEASFKATLDAAFAACK